MGPIRRAHDEGEELASYFIDNDEAGVFAVGFARRDGGGADTDEGNEGSSYLRREGEGVARGGEDVGGGVPEENGEDAAVGSGAGLEVTGAEEGGEGPGPAGVALRGH